jgi:hypothetical protein
VEPAVSNGGALDSWLKLAYWGLGNPDFCEISACCQSIGETERALPEEDLNVFLVFGIICFEILLQKPKQAFNDRS